MGNFWIALLGGGFGVLVAALFSSKRPPERTVRGSLAVGLAAVAGGSLSGLVSGRFWGGFTAGLGMGVAIIVVPPIANAVRSRWVRPTEAGRRHGI